MEYRQYGQTGKNISRLGFGGMRFARPRDVSAMAEVVLAAHQAGISYFDTAPGYCSDMSEKIIGYALRQVNPGDGDFYLSTKTSKPDAEGVRADLQRSLERLGVDCIDFYHCWYILTLDAWERRKTGRAVDALLRAREDGLVRHLAFTTHLPGDEVEKIIGENIFEGVIFGYNAINFPYRQQALKAAARAGIGLVVMNPLGGGTITENPDTFSFIRAYPGQPMVEAALNFLWSHSEITSALVGFSSVEDVKGAVAAWKSYDPTKHRLDLDKVKARIEESFDSLCTGCRYCRDCPEGIEVYKYLEAYNHVILKGGEGLGDRLRWHHGIENLDDLERCTGCGACEEACTQHLPILERFDRIRELYGK
ncbi:MAG: aldo/keto reductase [Candidatus Glassbacteria bacterium]|nr:aldo/keto reductase [Candidatus Glassbacteria bacterium]